MDNPSETGSAYHDPPALSVVLSHQKAEKADGPLHRLEQIAKIVSLVLLPFAVALGGWWVQRSLAFQAVNKDYVALAVSLLDSSREVPAEMRGWAVDMLNRSAPIPFADSVSARLRSGELNIPSALDAREAVIRTSPTNLTRLVAQAMMRATPGADLALLNSSAIRLDSVVSVSALSALTVLQMLPFGDEIHVVGMSGRLIENLLQTNAQRVGRGMFLHTANVDYTDRWRIAGEPIVPSRQYTVATIEILARNVANIATPAESVDVRFLYKSKPMVEAVIDELLRHVSLRQ